MIADLGSNPSPTMPFLLITSILEFLNENSDFMKAVLSPKGDLSFQTKLKDFMWKTLFEDTNGALINKENLLVPSQYLASYMASAHIGVIQQWLNSGQKHQRKLLVFYQQSQFMDLLCSWFKEVSYCKIKDHPLFIADDLLLHYNTSIYPSVPCTRIRCPSFINFVAFSTPTTAGNPYSRAITARES